MDGRQQRRALTAAEQAIAALAAGDGARAGAAAARAAELDQLGIFAGLPVAIESATGAGGGAGWDAVAAALPPGPLREAAVAHRSDAGRPSDAPSDAEHPLR